MSTDFRRACWRLSEWHYSPSSWSTTVFSMEGTAWEATKECSLSVFLPQGTKGVLIQGTVSTKGTCQIVPAGCLSSSSLEQRLRGFPSYRKNNGTCCLNITFPIDRTCFSLLLAFLKWAPLQNLTFPMPPRPYPPFIPPSVALENHLEKRAVLRHCLSIFSDPGLATIPWKEAHLFPHLTTVAVYTEGALRATPVSPGNESLQMCLRCRGPW